MADSRDLTAYARSLGIVLESDSAGAPVLAIEFSKNIEGRTGAFHGGATAGLLETAGYAALRRALAEAGRSPLLKPINITVQYLAAGKQKTSHAQGRVTRLGNRNANIEVEAWQDDRARPIASAVMNVLMVEDEA